MKLDSAVGDTEVGKAVCFKYTSLTVLTLCVTLCICAFHTCTLKTVCP